MARVYETVTVLLLLGALVLGMTYVLSALLDHQKSNLHTLLSKYCIRAIFRKFRCFTDSCSPYKYLARDYSLRILQSDKIYDYKIYRDDMIIVNERLSVQMCVLSDLWSYYLPFLYSCVSFVGVVMLLREYRGDL